LSLIISEECIACDACIEECPNYAIEATELNCVIEPEKCTECIDVYDEPSCIASCPVDCISVDQDHIENAVELRLKYKNNPKYLENVKR